MEPIHPFNSLILSYIMSPSRAWEISENRAEQHSLVSGTIIYRHTANAPKVNQEKTENTTTTHQLRNLPGVLALKIAGKAEGVTGNINTGCNRRMKMMVAVNA